MRGPEPDLAWAWSLFAKWSRPKGTVTARARARDAARRWRASAPLLARQIAVPEVVEPIGDQLTDLAVWGPDVLIVDEGAMHGDTRH